MDDAEVFKTVLGVIMPQIEVQQIMSLESEEPLLFNYFTHGVVFDIQAKLRAKDNCKDYGCEFGAVACGERGKLVSI